MDEINYNLELLSFNEKISLAKLEVTKAQERVAEIEYELSRYQIEWLRHMAKARDAAIAAQNAKV
jgi:hypothetical protein